MIANLGSIDRLFSAAVGLILLFAPLLNLPVIWSSAALAYGSMGVGLVLIVTALFRFCPLYRVFGITTCKL